MTPKEKLEAMCKRIAEIEDAITRERRTMAQDIAMMAKHGARTIREGIAAEARARYFASS